MKYLIAILVLFASCNPYKKIEKDSVKTDAEKAILAKVCQETFPVRPSVKIDTLIKTDTLYNGSVVKSLIDMLDKYTAFQDSLVSKVEIDSLDKQELIVLLYKKQSLVDTLKRRIEVECGSKLKESKIIHTQTTIPDSAAIYYWQARNAESEKKLSAANAQIQELKDTIDSKNNIIRWFIIIAALLGLGVAARLFLKF